MSSSIQGTIPEANDKLAQKNGDSQSNPNQNPAIAHPNSLAESRTMERNMKTLYSQPRKKNPRSVYLKDLAEGMRKFYVDSNAEFKKNQKYTKTRINSVKIIQHNFKKVLNYFQKNDYERNTLSRIIKEMKQMKAKLNEAIVKPKMPNEKVSICRFLESLQRRKAYIQIIIYHIEIHSPAIIIHQISNMIIFILHLLNHNECYQHNHVSSEHIRSI